MYWHQGNGNIELITFKVHRKQRAKENVFNNLDVCSAGSTRHSLAEIDFLMFFTLSVVTGKFKRSEYYGSLKHVIAIIYSSSNIGVVSPIRNLFLLETKSSIMAKLMERKATNRIHYNCVSSKILRKRDIGHSHLLKLFYFTQKDYENNSMSRLAAPNISKRCSVVDMVFVFLFRVVWNSIDPNGIFLIMDFGCLIVRYFSSNLAFGICFLYKVSWYGL